MPLRALCAGWSRGGGLAGYVEGPARTARYGLDSLIFNNTRPD
jgi:hypothetical protein